MGWQINWLEVARDDLKEIVEFIAKDNPKRALEEGSFIISKIESLMHSPERGSRLSRIDFQDVYQIVVKHYRIIYHIKKDQQRVEIWRIWHGARGEVIIHPPD